MVISIEMAIAPNGDCEVCLVKSGESAVDMLRENFNHHGAIRSIILDVNINPPIVDRAVQVTVPEPGETPTVEVRQ